MRLLIPLLVFLALLGCSAGEAPAPAAATWTEDYPAALAAAKAAGRPLLVNFSGSDWCGWCIRLDAEVFSQPAFAAWARDRVGLAVLDFPRAKPQDAAVKTRNQALFERFGVEGFPTVLVLDPEGRELGRLGYLPGGPGAWTAAAEALLPPAPARP